MSFRGPASVQRTYTLRRPVKSTISDAGLVVVLAASVKLFDHTTWVKFVSVAHETVYGHGLAAVVPEFMEALHASRPGCGKFVVISHRSFPPKMATPFPLPEKAGLEVENVMVFICHPSGNAPAEKSSSSAGMSSKVSLSATCTV